MNETTEHEVVEDGLSAEDAKVLECSSDPHPRYLMRSIVKELDCLAVALRELHRCSRFRFVDSSDCIHQGRLAGPIRTDKSKQLPWVDFEREVIAGDDTSELNRQIGDLEDWFCCHRFTSRRIDAYASRMSPPPPM